MHKVHLKNTGKDSGSIKEKICEKLHLLPGTRFWKAQCFVLAGTFCLLLALIGPLHQSKMISNYANFSRINHSAGLLKAWGHERLGAWVLILLCAAMVWSALNLRFALTKKIWLGFVVVHVMVFVVALQNIDIYDDLTLTSFLPVYFRTTSGTSLGWAWIFFLLTPFLFWIAVDKPLEPTDEERELLLPPKPRPAQVFSAPARHSPPSVPPVTNSPQASTAAKTVALPVPKASPSVPVDVGLCAACQVRNSLRATRCHACGAVLPWEEQKLAKQAQAAKASAARQAQAAQVGSAAGSTALTGLLYFLVFLLCMSMPLIGYFIWRVIDAGESKYAGAAFFGWIAGGVLIVGTFLLRMLLVMSKVGAS